MKTSKALAWISLLLLVACKADPVDEDPQEASYQVTFTATWSAATHLGAFPSNAHFSKLIGAVHGADGLLWATGSKASAGMEQMAELGGTAALTEEANALITAGTARE